MQVKEVMSRRIIAISPEETVAVAARLLSQHNIGALPVCSRDGRLRGMVTDRDIVVRCVAAGDDPERTCGGCRCRSAGGSSAWCRWAMSPCARITPWRLERRCRKFRRISAGSSRAGHPARTAC